MYRRAIDLHPSPLPDGKACSAKGAAFMISLGQRPRYSCVAKALALKARFIPRTTWVVLTAKWWVETRLQRLFIVGSEPWSDAPGLNETAPLARYSEESRPTENKMCVCVDSSLCREREG